MASQENILRKQNNQENEREADIEVRIRKLGFFFFCQKKTMALRKNRELFLDGFCVYWTSLPNAYLVQAHSGAGIHQCTRQTNPFLVGGH